MSPGSFESDGYAVVRGAVPEENVRAAVRLLHLAIRRWGLTADQVAEWQLGTFFPHLRWEPEIWALLPDAAGPAFGIRDGDEWAEPQIVMRLPDEPQEWTLTPHVDTLPPWAADRAYRGVAGVALTDAGPRDGTMYVWPGSHRAPLAGDPVPVPMRAGDVLLMHPELGHTGSLNLGHTFRIAVYFRLLTAARVPAAPRVPGAASSMTTSGNRG